MDLATLEKVIPELRDALDGRRLGKIFQLSKFEFAVDFRLAESRYVFISVSPADPRIYLIRRRLRDLERASINPSPFAVFLRKQISNAVVRSVERVENERVVKIRVDGESEMGERFSRSLIVQLTGKSSNLFLADESQIILDRLRETRGDGQEIGTKYSPPERPSRPETIRLQVERLPEGPVSEYLDSLDLEKRATNEVRVLVNAATARLNQKLSKLKRRLKQLEHDLTSHGDAEKWKRLGDVLLANVSTAKRADEAFIATDYFEENTPEISIPFENDDSVTETAEKYFRKYTKTRNAKEEVAARIAATDKEIGELERLGAELTTAIANEDREFIANFLVTKKHPIESSKKKSIATDGTARSFTSSDGFEILVGKKARDNDVLTFKIAKSLDTWMHAADYPGSHVVIRNPNRKEIPHRTLIEAAELAAFYSQGKTQPKAAVHYTQKKFVNKPKGAAPGLVSLSSFKTLLVEPKVPQALAA